MFQAQVLLVSCNCNSSLYQSVVKATEALSSAEIILFYSIRKHRIAYMDVGTSAMQGAIAGAGKVRMAGANIFPPQ